MEPRASFCMSSSAGLCQCHLHVCSPFQMDCVFEVLGPLVGKTHNRILSTPAITKGGVDVME